LAHHNDKQNMKNLLDSLGIPEGKIEYEVIIGNLIKSIEGDSDDEVLLLLTNEIETFLQ